MSPFSSQRTLGQEGVKQGYSQSGDAFAVDAMVYDPGYVQLLWTLQSQRS